MQGMRFLYHITFSDKRESPVSRRGRGTYTGVSPRAGAIPTICEGGIPLYTETSSCTPANGCPQNQGSLPGGCGALAFPFVAMQQQDPPRYDQREALQQGTLFPGLDLPFHKELRSRFPAANNALSELMALDFAIDELGLYLVTHADDQEVLNLYWKYIALAKEGRARYQEQYGPLTQTTVTEGGYRWLNDPWPWDEGGSD